MFFPTLLLTQLYDGLVKHFTMLESASIILESDIVNAPIWRISPIIYTVPLQCLIAFNTLEN